MAIKDLEKCDRQVSRLRERLDHQARARGKVHGTVREVLVSHARRFCVVQLNDECVTVAA